MLLSTVMLSTLEKLAAANEILKVLSHARMNARAPMPQYSSCDTVVLCTSSGSGINSSNNNLGGRVENCQRKPVPLCNYELFRKTGSIFPLQLEVAVGEQNRKIPFGQNCAFVL